MPEVAIAQIHHQGCAAGEVYPHPDSRLAGRPGGFGQDAEHVHRQDGNQEYDHLYRDDGGRPKTAVREAAPTAINFRIFALSVGVNLFSPQRRMKRSVSSCAASFTGSASNRLHLPTAKMLYRCVLTRRLQFRRKP